MFNIKIQCRSSMVLCVNPDSNLSSTTYQLCYFSQVTPLLYASIFSSVKIDDSSNCSLGVVVNYKCATRLVSV